MYFLFGLIPINLTPSPYHSLCLGTCLLKEMGVVRVVMEDFPNQPDP